MNFNININLEKNFPDFAVKNANSPSAYRDEDYQPIDRSFEKILEKSSNNLDDKEIQSENTKSDKSNTETALENKVTNTIESIEDKISIESIEDKISQLLNILEKLVQQKEVSPQEASFFLKNLPFLKEITGKLISANNSIINNPDFLKFIQSNQEFIKLPKETLEQIKQLSEFLAKHLAKHIGNKIEKLSDLSNWNNFEKGQSGEPLRSQEIYIKNKDRFNVLKGDLSKSAEGVNNPNLNTQINKPQLETKVNPTHQNQQGNQNQIANNNNINSVNGTIQKNLVINSTSTGGDQSFSGKEFSGQGGNPSLLRSTGMFTDNSLPRSLNFKSLIQHLTGRIHNGFLNGKQVMMVKLQPENLGQVQILLKKESENSLHLKLKVDTPEVKELLDKSIFEIKLGLNKEKLDLLSFNVDVSDSNVSQQSQEQKGEEKFSEFSRNPQNDFSTVENSKTIDLRMTDSILNIRI